MKYHFKNGKQIIYTNKGWHYTYQYKTQGEPLNGHQPRLGTKVKAGSRGCHCEECMKNAKGAKYKQLKKDFEKQKKEIDI